MKRHYWGSESDESLITALHEYEEKDPVALRDVINDIYDELAERHNIFGRKMITCAHVYCGQRFFYVPERRFPTLCLDHAADMPAMCI